MGNGSVEIITGRERRRRWSLEDKLRIVAETHEPGARVTEVAGKRKRMAALAHHGFCRMLVCSCPG